MIRVQLPPQLNGSPQLVCITFAVHKVHFYALYVTALVVITPTILHFIRLSVVRFSSLSLARKLFFLSFIEKELFYVVCVIFLCCARRKGEWIWVYALLNLLKHWLREDGKREGKKLQKIAHKPDTLRRAKYVNFFCNSYVERDHACDFAIARESWCSFPFFRY